MLSLLPRLLGWFTISATLVLPVAAQTPESFLKTHPVIPPSPTAASLGTYGEVGVGYYTGLPDIGVPLYEVQGRNINLPIRLQYNAGGTRVAENASWVGLGWSLSAGGAITRTVRGIDDFKNNGDAGTGYYYTAALPEPTNPDGYNPYETIALGHSEERVARDKAYFVALNTGRADGEPDVYCYNFGPFAGKFVLGKSQDGSPVFVDERNNLKIEYLGGNWRVIDAKGYQYSFATQEASINYTYGSGSTAAADNIALSDLNYQPDLVTTAWYLSKITTPAGEEVRFEYNRGESLSLLSKAEEEHDLVQTIKWCNGSFPVPAVYKVYTASKQVINDVYLSKIVFSKGTIEFNTSPREDIEFRDASRKPAKLSEIIIKDQRDQLVKRYAFQYSYFYTQHGVLRSLKLDAITEYGSNGIGLPPYLFEYYDPNLLPNKNSVNLDHWGFYNDRLNQTGTLLPTISAGDYDKVFAGSDRRADQTNLYPRRGVLSSVTYPTGGKTVFDYELHSYANLQGEDRYEDATESALARAYPGNADDASAKFIITGHPESDPDDPGAILTVNYAYNEANCATEGCQLRSTYTSLFHLEKIDNNGNILQHILIVNNTPNPGGEPFTKEEGTRTVRLKDGQYRLRVWPVPGYSLSMNASWKSSRFIPQTNGGGLRIKSITNYDGDKIVKQRKFLYTVDGTSTGLTSGLLITQPRYHVYTQFDTQGGNVGDCWSTYVTMMRMSSSLNPVGLASKGGTVAYSKVTELVGAGGEGGKIEYNYHNKADQIPLYPGLPTQGDAWNGKLQKTVVYNAAGERLKQTEYEYQDQETFSLRGTKTFHPPYFTDLVNGGFVVKYYRVFSTWNTLAAETETNYKSGEAMTVSKRFAYEKTLHKELTREQVLTSEGKQLTTHYLYPSDYTNTTGFIGEMKNAHVLGVPVEQVTTVADKVGGNQQILSASLTTYHTGTKIGLPAQQWNLRTTAPIPLAQFKFSNQAASGTLPTNTPAEFTSKDAHYFDNADQEMAYDAQGQLQQVHKYKDVATSFLWGYGHTLPVAQIQNATKAQVTNELSAMGYDAEALPTDETQLRDVFTLLRSRLSQARITSFTHKPLVGMTSQTDPNGRTTYFEYDALGRLLRTTDEKGRLLQQQEYKYALQP